MNFAQPLNERAIADGFCDGLILTKSHRPSARTEEKSVKRNVIPQTPVMSAICVKIFHLYAAIETVPQGYARIPVDLIHSQNTHDAQNQSMRPGIKNGWEPPSCSSREIFFIWAGKKCSTSPVIPPSRPVPSALAPSVKIAYPWKFASHELEKICTVMVWTKKIQKPFLYVSAL